MMRNTEAVYCVRCYNRKDMSTGILNWVFSNPFYVKVTGDCSWGTDNAPSFY